MLQIVYSITESDSTVCSEDVPTFFTSKQLLELLCQMSFRLKNFLLFAFLLLYYFLVCLSIYRYNNISFYKVRGRQKVRHVAHVKMFWVFTLKVLLHPVIEIKILNLTGIEDFMLENYSCCSSLNLFMFEKFHYASVQKILARFLAENSEKSVCYGPTQDCRDLILPMITAKLHKMCVSQGPFC